LPVAGGRSWLQEQRAAGVGGKSAIVQVAIHIVQARFVQCSIVG